MDGKGVKFRINNNTIIKEYEGDFVEGIYEGNGKLYNYDENGNLLDYYIGQMINGKEHGKGKLYEKNHDIIYDGEFAFGKYDGFGRLNQDSTRQSF
jgi:hypothetical protein